MHKGNEAGPDRTLAKFSVGGGGGGGGGFPAELEAWAQQIGLTAAKRDEFLA